MHLFKKVFSFIIPQNKNKRRIVFISSIHSIWLIFFSFLWIYFPHTFGFEFDVIGDVIDVRNFITYNIIKTEKKSLKDSFVLLNCVYANELCPYKNEMDTLNIESRAKNFTRTNRSQLAECLSYLNDSSNNFKHIVLDVAMEERYQEKNDFWEYIDNSNELKINDSTLFSVISQLDKKNKITLIRNGESIEKVVFNIFDKGYFSPTKNYFYPNEVKNSSLGTVIYNPDYNNYFYKFNYVESDSIGNRYKQVPLVVHEKLTGRSYKYKEFLGYPFLISNQNQICMNRFVPRMYYTDDDLIIKNKVGGDSINLIVDINDYILNVNKNNEYNSLIGMNKSSIIVIGRFKDLDIHNTTIGRISGSLILVNLIIALNSNNHIISFMYVFTLFIFFFLISYNTFYKMKVDFKKEENVEKFKYNLTKLIYSTIIFISEVIIENRNYLLLLILTIISFEVFGHYLFFFVISIYLFLVELILKFFKIIIKNKI